MNRAEAAAHVGEWYGSYLSEIGRAAADTDGNLRAVINAAARAMGATDETLLTFSSPDREGFEAQVEYHALRMIVHDLGTNAHVSVRAGTFHLEMIRKHAAEDLARAQARVLEIFGSTKSGARGVIKMNLNYRQPTIDEYFEGVS